MINTLILLKMKNLISFRNSSNLSTAVNDIFTVTRYQKEKKKLSHLQSKYILKTIVLFNKGNQLFGNKESFNCWLDKPAFGLGNSIPRIFITKVGSINYVIEELSRVAHVDLA